MKSLLLIAVALTTFSARARADDAPPEAPEPGDEAPPALRGLDVHEHLGKQLPLDLSFKDQTGRSVTLREALHPGRPLVLTLVYFDCPMLCSLVMEGLSHGLSNLTGWKLGQQYDALTVSFNPADTQEKALDRRRAMIDKVGATDAPGLWPFLTGDGPSIDALAQAVGFDFRYDRDAKQFAHNAVIFVLTPEGKVSRYLYGVHFEPLQLRLAFTEAGEGKSGSSFERFLLSCYHYDPGNPEVRQFDRRPPTRLGGVSSSEPFAPASAGLFWRERHPLPVPTSTASGASLLMTNIAPPSAYDDFMRQILFLPGAGFDHRAGDRSSALSSLVGRQRSGGGHPRLHPLLHGQVSPALGSEANRARSAPAGVVRGEHLPHPAGRLPLLVLHRVSQLHPHGAAARRTPWTCTSWARSGCGSSPTRAGPTPSTSLRVPAHRPVRLLMTSRDVIHSFYVPEFRIKQDVPPGRTPTRSGSRPPRSGPTTSSAPSTAAPATPYGGKVQVMEPADFDKWMATQREGLALRQDFGGPLDSTDPADKTLTMAKQGQKAAAQLQCFKCHSIDGTRAHRPHLAGPVPLQGEAHRPARRSSSTRPT